MDRTELSELVQKTDVFKSFPSFKQKLTLSKANMEDLCDLYSQAERHSIGYLRQNNRLQSSTVKLIEQCLNISKCQ